MPSAASPPSSFIGDLLSIMDAKHHPAWPVLMGPGTARAQLALHYRQEYVVYVRDFPVLLARVHSRCPVPAVRRDLAENLYEEETGRLSGTGPHPDLFLDMMEALGFARQQFDDVDLLPAARVYRDWLDEATLERRWEVGAAVVTLFVEGSVADRHAVEGRPRPASPLDRDPLVLHHGLQPSDLVLKQAHSRVEAGHRAAAWRIVEEQVTSPAARMAVQEAMARSLRLWLAYRDAVSLACGIATAPAGRA